MHVVLISTYDLGRQPFGLASPAAWLREAGFKVSCFDLAVHSLDEADVSRAGLVAVHLPMHTATRVATGLAPRLRRLNPEAHLCFYGLYAPLNERLLRELGADSIIGGEFEEELAALAGKVAEKGRGAVPGQRVSLDKLAFRLPDRSDLGALDHYARLRVGDGEERLVGYTEASRGCRHMCRHCSIVPVYEGRFRIVPREIVLADVEQQVEKGARHITFGDPEFFNGADHAVALVRGFHRRFPETTYDVTIKVEHLRRHAEHLPALRETGCLFVTTAVESIDDRVLGYLQKGHTRDDFLGVVRSFREVGLVLQPTFVAFHPWLSLEGYVELLESVARLGLTESVAQVQLALRLLITEGSKLLDLADVREMVGAFDPESLIYPWTHPDPRVDTLQREVHALVEDAAKRDESRSRVFRRVWDLATRRAGEARPLPEIDEMAWSQRAPIPYLTEPWYC